MNPTMPAVLSLNPESTCVDASAAGLRPHSAPGWFRPAPLADRQRKCFPGLARWIIGAIVAVLATNVTAQQPAELMIRNGLIVTSVGRTDGDLRIRNGAIAEMGRNLTTGAGARVIDASGLLVLPGG